MKTCVLDYALHFVNRFRLRLRTLLRARGVERDLEDELGFHLAMQVQANTKAGMPQQQAEQAAKRQFGGLVQH
jgi:hypothetical protein